MRVVIDTNCLVASISPEGGYYWLYEAFEAEQFEWLISNEILFANWLRQTSYSNPNLALSFSR